jgi:hypothetical protein
MKRIKVLVAFAIVATMLFSLSAPAFAINKNAVGNYAEGYAYNYNPNYASFSSDCANFVSQSLCAGGYAMDSTWYNKKVLGIWTWGQDWSVAAKLKTYLVNKRSGTETPRGYAKNLPYYVTYLNRGDAVFYNLDGTGIGHSSVVTYPNYAGFTSVSAHSTNRNNTYWTLYPHLNANQMDKCTITTVYTR